MPSYAPAARIGCPYCGLISDGSLSHGRIGDCVDALRCEVMRLRERVRQDPPGVPVHQSGIGSARWRRAGSACDCPVIESAWWQVAAAAPIARQVAVVAADAVPEALPGA